MATPSLRNNSTSQSSVNTSEQISPVTTPASSIVDEDISDDVAVIGMACRLPGDNNSPEQLWDSLLTRKDASGDLPSMRWEPYLGRGARNKKELAKITSKGYFLSNLEDFDCSFFGISPKEAEQMDPQQRISLEVAWEALEDAGIPPGALSGSNTCVFMGVNSDDYSKLVLEDLPNVEAWMGIGTAYCGVPNRISYHLNLMGPSTAVDAACASSLVAIHHGRQAILSGESNIAIVGGVNALCGPGLTSVLDKAGAICAEGSCMSFDDDAHGYGRGEGAGIVVLKSLRQALRDGDDVKAVLKGTAVAQDGKTKGIMAPNSKAQELVARNALAVAGVDPMTIQYVEAHATSTPLGDPTEIQAISSVYGENRPSDAPVIVGSVKPNVGHLEAGAGVVGFIKGVKVLQKGQVPPQANLRRLNTKVAWAQCGVKVAQDLIQLPKTDTPHRAAVCSYGYGGTVSHAIVEAASNGTEVLLPHQDHGEQLLLLSAPQQKRLGVQAAAYHAWLSTTRLDRDMQKVASTLALHRENHDHRIAIVVENSKDAAIALKAIADGTTPQWCTRDMSLMAEQDRSLTWVFSGHGAQWPEMGVEMLQIPSFLAAVAELENTVVSEMGFSALKSLKDGDFGRTDEVQVLTYIMQIGLSAVLQSKGVVPQAVVGHSVGEIAAAVAAGCLTAKEGALLVCRRAKLYREVAGLGAMYLIALPFAEVKAELAGRQDVVAAIDTSTLSCVVSGQEAAVHAYAKTLTDRGVKATQVKSDVAFHSPMLEPLGEPLVECLGGLLSPQPARIPLYSTSSTDPRCTGIRDSEYWVNNMVNPVLLTSAIDAAVEDGRRLFMEISSHPIVSHSISETCEEQGLENFHVIPTMLRGKPANKSLLSAVGKLYCTGASVDMRMLTGPAWDPDVPGTVWAHKPIWRKVDPGSLEAVTRHDVDKHTLLGERLLIAGTDLVIYNTKLDANTKPFPGDHPLHGTEIVPAAVLINTFLHATQATSLSNVVLKVPVALGATREVQIQVADKDSHVKITSRLERSDEGLEESSWVTHTTSQFHTDACSDNKISAIDIDATKARIADTLPSSFSIDYLAKVGVSAMGFPWQVSEHYGNLHEMIALVDAAPDIDDSRFPQWDSASWAPLLDAATSIGSTIFYDDPKLRMPAQIGEVIFTTSDSPPKTGWIRVERAAGMDVAVNVDVLNTQGEVLVRITAMRFAEIEGTPGTNRNIDSFVHHLAWTPAVYSEEPVQFDHVVLIGEQREDFGSQLLTKKLDFTWYSTFDDYQKSLATRSEVERTAIFHLPGSVASIEDVSRAALQTTDELLQITKHTAKNLPHGKVFVITTDVFNASSATALSHAPLRGLARIIASECPDVWGAMIDLEGPDPFPLSIMKYVKGQDTVRVIDGVPRISRLRPMPRESLRRKEDCATVLPKPEGTYVITGGMGALGLEVADFLVAKGARRLVLLSRRALPPRSQWPNASEEMTPTIQRILALEAAGATVYAVSLDITKPTATDDLLQRLEDLQLPPVLGVVHAAGVLENELVLETTREAFGRVLDPKVSGALALHKAFPPGKGGLDFFLLFSSCGQLFGFPGQGSYASGSAFLDGLATHRRGLGDNSVSMLWTSWRGAGMGSSSEAVKAELESRGITDITPEDAFRAWEHVEKFDVDHAVVLRSAVFDTGEELPTGMLADIAVRRAVSENENNSEQQKTTETSSSGKDEIPTQSPELDEYLLEKIRSCVAKVLMLDGADEVEPNAALSDLGLDSVMTVALRRRLQAALGVKVPPTLTWSHPTCGHLVGWFKEKLQGA
uniref:6-methylsalicylic acid synthase n=1 Tax=Cladosporium phlei TaxID=1116209 RepID=J7H3M3_9PEZI|nr:polyketide synthase [Cladosporium phlei]